MLGKEAWNQVWWGIKQLSIWNVPMQFECSQLIKNARKQKSMSVRSLATLIERADGKCISPSYITDIEMCRGIPSPTVAANLAKALGIPEQILHDACERDRHKRSSSL